MSDQSSGVPMPGIDKATGRVAVLILLLALAAAALRGYLPASAKPDDQHRAGPASVFLLVALLSATLAILVVAIIARIRNPRASAGSLTGLAEGAAGRGGRPTWRAALVLLIGLAVLIGWLLITMLLLHLAGHYGIRVRAPDQGAHTGTVGPDGVPQHRDTAPPSPRLPRPGPGGDVFSYLAATAAGLVLVTLVATVIGARRRPGTTLPLIGAEAGPEPEPAGSGSLVRAAELGLAEIGDLGRGPREAIIACYATMERELAHVPDAMPQEFDTPTEVLVRAVEHHALRADNAAQLVKLFAEARFSPHVMNEDHRDAAVRVLRLVLAELPRSTS